MANGVIVFQFLALKLGLNNLLFMTAGANKKQGAGLDTKNWMTG